MPSYYLDGDTVYSTTTQGAIGQDGNPQWLGYLAWLEAGNTPGEPPA